MKKNPIMIVVVLVAVGVTVLLAQGKEKRPPRFDFGGVGPQTLEERLDALEDRVATLERDNGRLRETVGRLKSVTPMPKPSWIKREFNGETFWVIPALDEKDGK